MSSTVAPMRPDHALESGYLRARSVMKAHGGRIDHPAVLATLLRWGKIYGELREEEAGIIAAETTEAEDDEPAEEPAEDEPPTEPLSDFAIRYGTDAYPMTEAPRDGTLVEVYLHHAWWIVHWETIREWSGWVLPDMPAALMYAPEAARPHLTEFHRTYGEDAYPVAENLEHLHGEHGEVLEFYVAGEWVWCQWNGTRGRGGWYAYGGEFPLPLSEAAAFRGPQKPAQPLGG